MISPSLKRTYHHQRRIHNAIYQESETSEDETDDETDSESGSDSDVWWCNCDHIVMTYSVVIERCIALNAGVNVMVIKTIEATPVWRFTKVHLLTFIWICGAFCFWRSPIWIPLYIAWRRILVWYDVLILIGLHNNSDHSQPCWWTLEIGSKNFAAEETQ